MFYGQSPRILGQISVDVEEFFSYTNMPIKLKGQHEPTYEPRLNAFNELIGTVFCDFVGEFGLDSLVDKYVYISAKHQYQREGSHFNRGGWHSDGFLSSDINYIWSDKQPTVFCEQAFNLTLDDTLSMAEMEDQAKAENERTYPENSLCCLTESVIHKVGEPIEGKRVFVKISFSEDVYALKGNSKNYMLDETLGWDYTERKTTRNVPQS